MKRAKCGYIHILNTFSLNYTLVGTSLNHCLWGSSKHVESSSVQIHFEVTMLDELVSFCKHKFSPCWSVVAKWSLESDTDFHEVLFLQSLENFVGSPSPAAVRHFLVLTKRIWPPSPSCIHLSLVLQLPTWTSFLLFTWMHWPLKGWYKIYSLGFLEIGSASITYLWLNASVYYYY